MFNYLYTHKDVKFGHRIMHNIADLIKLIDVFIFIPFINLNVSDEDVNLHSKCFIFTLNQQMQSIQMNFHHYCDSIILIYNSNFIKSK
jgi:hypothetical protein